MKAKNQQNYTSEIDAKEKLIVYVYEYLVHAGAKQAADLFKENIGYNKDIKINESPGFLHDWWCVFWDLYCAAPERRHSQPESSADARAFHDFMRSTPMSPSIAQSSPPQHPQQQQQQQPPPQFMTGGPRYGPPPPGQPRGPMPRMQGPPPQHGPHQGGPPPGGFMPAVSPRYAQHQGPPHPPPPHMNQGPPMGFGPGPEQMGHSPGPHRMTPVGSLPPPQQQVVGPPPPNGPPQMMPGGGGPPPQQQMGGPPPPPPNHQGQVQQGPGGVHPPPRNGSQGSVSGGVGPGSAGGWPQGASVNYNVSSPYPGGPPSNQPVGQGAAGQPTGMMMSDGSVMEVRSSPLNGGEPSTPHSADEYVMPVPFGQDQSDQSESAEILKLKQSMQEDTSKMFDKDQSEFGMGEYSESQNKWS